MSVPPDQMAAMMGGGGGPPGGGMPPGGASPPPMASPMSTPEPKSGQMAGAKVQAQIAMTMLEQALPQVGSDTKEGKAILTCLKALGGAFGASSSSSGELIPAEIMSLMQGLPQVGGGGQEQQFLMNQAAGGGAPPGAPPGGGMPGMPG